MVNIEYWSKILINDHSSWDSDIQWFIFQIWGPVDVSKAMSSTRIFSTKVQFNLSHVFKEKKWGPPFTPLGINDWIRSTVYFNHFTFGGTPSNLSSPQPVTIMIRWWRRPGETFCSFELPIVWMGRTTFQFIQIRIVGHAPDRHHWTLWW